MYCDGIAKNGNGNGVIGWMKKRCEMVEEMVRDVMRMDGNLFLVVVMGGIRDLVLRSNTHVSSFLGLYLQRYIFRK